jgi:hypothetical protein
VALKQLQQSVVDWGAAGGTADALTVSLTPTPTLVDGMIVRVRAGSANATTTPTLAVNGGTARTITKQGNAALVAGDIVGAGHELLLVYVASTPRFELLNPKGISSVTLANLDINGGTETTSVEHNLDFLSMYDASASANRKLKARYIGAGNLDFFVPATAMIGRVTAGPSVGNIETTTNKVNLRGFSFDPATIEYVQWPIVLPRRWNLSDSFGIRFVWYHPSTTTNFDVRWAARAIALSNDDAPDQALGTAQGVTDTGGTTNDVYITDQISGSSMISGTPAAGDLVVFEFYRDATNGADTLAVDAVLLGVIISITADKNTDETF